MHEGQMKTATTGVKPQTRDRRSPGVGNRAAKVYGASGRTDGRRTPTGMLLKPVQTRAASPTLQASDPGWLESIAVGGEYASKQQSSAPENTSDRGMPLAPEVRAPLDRQFGTSFADVRIHQDGVAQANNALGVAMGNDIHLAPGQFQPETQAGRFLLGHELAHVVQQKNGAPGTQYKQSVNVSIDTADIGLEAEADRIGTRVAAGESVAGQILGRAPRGLPQRFDAKEHREMGNQGSQGAIVQLADDYSLPFGDVVALAGDHFESIEQMRAFARNNRGGANSRDEIEFARAWKFEHEGTYKNKDEAEAAQKNRYYTLAGSNDVHFSNPTVASSNMSTGEKALETTPRFRLEGFQWQRYDGPSNAIAAYRMNHVRAIAEAAHAGANHQPIDSALATDAFGCHFLSDSFASGHVRTQRTDARAYWNAKVPMFFFNLKGFIAERIAKKLQESGEDSPHEIDYDNLPQQMVFVKSYEKVKDAIESMGRVNFGDIVGLALHDWDNDTGIKAMVQGKRVTLMGDSKAGGSSEQKLAIRAISASIDDIHAAYALGVAGSIDDAPMQLLGSDGLYEPERQIPEAVPDNQLTGQNPDSPEGNRTIMWDYPDLATLMAQPDFQRAVAVFCQAKAIDVQGVGADFDETQKWALIESVINPLTTDPVGTLWRVINWTPDIEHGLLGKADDNARTYMDEANATHGGMQSLTSTQRINLIVDLMKGWKITDNEEEQILKLLLTASDTDARRVIEWIQWDDLAKALEGAEDSTFRARFPKELYRG